MKKFNQDYKITISGDINGNAYWGLLRKGEPAACNEDEIRMVAQVFGELKEKIDKLSRIIEPSVTIHFTDPSRAVTIAPIDPLYQGEEITILLMPMLVND